MPYKTDVNCGPSIRLKGAVSLLCLLLFSFQCAEKAPRSAFSRDNLVAWCIVPFDSEKRGPEDRATMLQDLGITKLAYDWRNEHIPTFDEEWRALKSHNIALLGFWIMAGEDPQDDKAVDAIFEFLARNKVKTQLWLLVTEWDGFNALDANEKLEAVSQRVAYIADRAAAIDCQVGLYNHRRWFGEPENQLAIIRRLNRTNIGMVYNFHHAVAHHERFADFFPEIKPHLYALNIAGIRNSDQASFYDLGDGDVEEDLLRVVIESGYDGPVGIINHDAARDARVGLLKQMAGLKKLLESMDETEALKSYD